MIERPEGLEGIYKLLLDKPELRQQDNVEADGYITLVDNKARLNRIISFSKPNNQSFYKIIESVHKTNQIDLIFDENNMMINKIFLRNERVECKKEIFSVLKIRNGMLALDEECSNKNIETFGYYVDDETPYAIEGSYKATFQDPEPTMYFRGKTIIQPTQDLSLSDTEMIADDSISYDNIIDKIELYRQFAIGKIQKFQDYFNKNEI